MLHSLFVKITSVAAAVGLAILGFFHLQVAQPPPHLGVAIPQVAQFFQDSLASGITSSQTTMTLVTGNDQSGNALTGLYGFVIDEGTSLQEVVTATASGTTITAMTRGLDPLKGITATTALQFAHRRGASVKITTSPWILIVNQILQGSSSLPSTLFYNLHPVAPASTTLIDKNYVDTVATSGAADAGFANTKGLVGLSSPLGAATSSDGANVLYNVIPTQFFSATSTATTTVVLTDASGSIPVAFISSSTRYTYILGNLTVNGTSTFTNQIASTSIATLSSSRVTSTANFTVSSTAAYITIGTSSVAGIASTTFTTGAHKVFLTFTGSYSSPTAGDRSEFDFSIDGNRTSGSGTNGGIQIGYVPVAGYLVPIGISYLTDVLSVGSHTFAAQVLNVVGTTTVYGANNANGNSSWVFTANEVYN